RHRHLTGEVDDRLAARDGGGHGCLVAHVAVDDLDATERGEPVTVPLAAPSREVVEHDDLVVARAKRLDEGRAQEAAATGDEDTHRSRSVDTRGVRTCPDPMFGSDQDLTPELARAAGAPRRRPRPRARVRAARRTARAAAAAGTSGCTRRPGWVGGAP